MSKSSAAGKTKRDPTGSIDPSDILDMYQAILPLLYDNPERLNVGDEIQKQLFAFVPFDFGYSIMEDPKPEGSQGRLYTIADQWGSTPTSDASTVSIEPRKGKPSSDDFEEVAKLTYWNVIARAKARDPRLREFHYHEIESRAYPRIAVGFFRRKGARSRNDFTREEKDLFDRLSPHIFLLYRSAQNQVYLSQAFQYFDTFTALGSKLASEHNLSESEVRLLPDILFGCTYKEMAEKHFISMETIRSHIKHILKKTGTKTRMELIGKFFTSPDRVRL